MKLSAVLRRLPPLNALKSFDAAARHESFTRAADELCVTQGAVSHQVKALETDLGVKLFNRERQRLVITEAGRQYLAVVRDAFDRIADRHRAPRATPAISYLVAVPIAERIGLIKTMVFTHLPSNIFLIFVPFAPNLWTAIALLLARSALSQMDVPTRASYVMAVVAPEERPAAASITAVPKTFAWAAGSLISGYLLTLSSFGWPLLIGGVIKGVYDILLLIKFQKVRPPEEARAVAN
jgi:hypothetical protein